MKKYLTFLIVICALAVILVSFKGNNALGGAVTAEFTVPVFSLNMDDDPSALKEEEVIDYIGVFTTDRYKGKVNRGWKFDNQGDFVITSSNDLLDAEEFTAMFWVQPAPRALERRTHIIWQGDLNEEKYGQYAGNGWGPEQEFHVSFGDEIGLHKYDDKKLTLYFGDEFRSVKASAKMTLADWQHVAVVVKNSLEGTEAKLYLDGNLVGEDRSDVKIRRDKWDDATLQVGKAGRKGPQADQKRDFFGSLDELAIYDKALSSDEISRICQRQNKGIVC